MFRLLVPALLALPLLISAPVGAQSGAWKGARAEVEASMLVTGHVDIDPQGRVSGHAVDDADALPPYVSDLVGRAVPAFLFEPVLEQGVPVPERAKMSLLVVATQTGDGGMSIRIRSAHFGDDGLSADAAGVRSVAMPPPPYPPAVQVAGGKGTVYLAIKVGRDGGVEDVAAEQVNLTAIGNRRQMQTIRDGLSRSAVAAARTWRFAPPTEGEDAARDFWVVRVPVEYRLDDHESEYGQWSAYHPGPRVRPAWAQPTPEEFSPDALIAGSVVPETSRFRLLTPLQGG